MFDCCPVGHVWEDGGEQDAVIVAASRRTVTAFASLAEWCGLEPVGLEPAPLGLHRWLVHALPGVFSRRMTVQISPRSVEVSFFEGEHLAGDPRSFLCRCSLFAERGASRRIPWLPG